jgi:hypothetical protein
MIEDEHALISLLRDANGGKPIASQRLTVQRLGWADDTEAEYDQIVNEESSLAYNDIIEPTI